MEAISIKELVELFGSGGAVILLVVWIWYKDFRTRRNGKAEPNTQGDILREIKALNINLSEISKNTAVSAKRVEDIWERG